MLATVPVAGKTNPGLAAIVGFEMVMMLSKFIGSPAGIVPDISNVIEFGLRVRLLMAIAALAPPMSDPISVKVAIGAHAIFCSFIFTCSSARTRCVLVGRSTCVLENETVAGQI